MREIYFAGGCFWGTEKLFRLIPGVVRTTVGYANGHTENPGYRDVCTDTTGHRETVRVEYDPAAVSLSMLLRAFFLVVDPTVANRQGGDVGSQYQTGVYYTDPADRPTLEEAFARERQKGGPFCVELLPLRCFYPAEEYHQDYLTKNPTGYCHISGAELAAVKKLFE
ncbi:MAG: peptide-methionine (S)-S-oxide reductase MsrA [Oscillospiraceae bacterium]|nr:peptide-methionine (S)-S-oxide reductase MsrA [Oscillospiraceae bacterium]